ncbi:RUN domain-containing protein 1 [Anopheles maculipalpis]|uniref:RUN domain-containing protein 1 n=1 Tax=Anopheles maculipalpis TaxID=1496333 RepID=UPI0021590BB8|nr:RUN domain-containing protein 1 [Anopheles maculipalpis]
MSTVGIRIDEAVSIVDQGEQACVGKRTDEEACDDGNVEADMKFGLFVEADRSMPRNSSEDEFDFDSAFSSESNQALTDESTTVDHHHHDVDDDDDDDDERTQMPDGRGARTVERERLKSLEDEHEILSSNLIALTSHFAQVQLRLRQIVEAPPQERDTLLKNLEEFAFLGIPEIQQNPVKQNIPEIVANLDRSPESVENLREKQQELIEQLKSQLMDLERYAYESGTPGILPQTILLEKQKVIIEEIKKKINLNLNELDLPQLTSEDLRQQVDSALDELVNPLKMKEQLVTQLKTQIQDLERFIGFLQTNEKAEIKKRFLEQQKQQQQQASKPHGKEASKELGTDRHTLSKPVVSSQCSSNIGSNHSNQAAAAAKRESFNSKAFGLMDKAGTLLQMFALSQFNCGSEHRTSEANYQTKMMARTRQNCWGDIRARLEYDVQEIASLVLTLQNEISSKEADHNEEDEDDATGRSNRSGNRKNYELTLLVRKRLAKTIQRLMQHGLRGNSETASHSLVPFISGCFSASTGGSNHSSLSARSNEGGFYRSDIRRKSTGGATTTAPTKKQPKAENTPDATVEDNLFSQLDDEEDDELESQQFDSNSDDTMHAWELLLVYYNIKNGDRYNSTPARKLSESFNLDIVDGRPLSNKQSLLSAIGSIVALHSPYKRSYDSQFKAFICAGLNAQKLTQWLYLIFQCKELVSSHYTSWSYVANTGFRDGLKTLDRLTQYRFDLPVDLSIRQFKNIKDVFM